MKTLSSQIEEFNSDTAKESKRAPSVIYKAGNKRVKVTLADPTHHKTQRYCFSDANDWKIVFDEDERQRNFPQHIVATLLRPDAVIYSDKAKKVYVMELNCGNEQNFADQEKKR